MKQVYSEVLGLLNPQIAPVDPNELAIYNQLKKIRWVDLDKGQLEYYTTRPAVAFPCSLIKIEITKTETIGNNVQRCNGRITVRLAFDYVGNTAAATPEPIREESLEYFDIAEAVYLVMQGKGNREVGEFNRSMAVEENRPDGLKVLSIVFTSTWLDKSAAL